MNTATPTEPEPQLSPGHQPADASGGEPAAAEIDDEDDEYEPV